MAEGFNQIFSDKLDKNNYPAWKFRMTNFLQGKGYWDFIDGENEAAPECPVECYSRTEKGLEGLDSRQE